MNKRLIVCCDGTWQRTDSLYPTNVAKLFQAIPVSSENLVFYGEGVGTGNLADRILGGALGWGIDQSIQDAYRFLCSNYAAGDRIYLFGFSRGAYTVRSLVGMIRAVGMLPRWGIRGTPKAYEAYQDAKGQSTDKLDSERQKIKLREVESLQKFRQDLVSQYGDDYQEEIKITFLGCWDTVGALGIPDQIPLLPLDQILNRKYQFHNTQLSSKILHARHAVSIDENRKEFDFTKMEPADGNSNQVRQVWFPGGHGCIGGGNRANSPLANAALVWMIEEVEALNLGFNFDQTKIEDGVQTNPTIFFSNELAFPFTPNDRVIPFTPNDLAIKDINTLHSSVQQRWQACPWYRPKSLNSESFNSQLRELPKLASVGLLAVGEKTQFVVMANEIENHSSIEIESGASYRISVSPTQVWQDAQIVCSAAGWRIIESDDSDWSIQGLETQKILAARGKFYQLSKNLSREPKAEWMELVVEIEGERYQIGSNLDISFTATTSGELISYANDAYGFYQNNHGWIFATIDRIS